MSDLPPGATANRLARPTLSERIFADERAYQRWMVRGLVAAAGHAVSVVDVLRDTLPVMFRG